MGLTLHATSGSKAGTLCCENFFTKKQPWSICSWIKYNTSVGFTYTQGKGLIVHSSPTAMYTSEDGYTYSEVSAEGDGIVANVWFHSAYVRNGNNHYGYCNGKLMMRVSGYDPSAFDAELQVGGIKYSETEKYAGVVGQMAALKAWHAALTPEEIRAEMYQYAPVRFADLGGYWPMLVYGGEAYTVRDQSGNGKHFTTTDAMDASAFEYWFLPEPKGPHISPFKPKHGGNRVPRLLNPIRTSICYGHDTGVTEEVKAPLAHFVTNGKLRNNPYNDYEVIELDFGQWAEMVGTIRMLGTVTCQVNTYRSYGPGTLTKYYKTGATSSGCEADTWKVFSTSFVSQGYVKVRFEAL
jgi:hypothetical protein